MNPTVQKVERALRALVTREILLDYDGIPIRLRKASYKRILNWIAVESSILARAVEPWGLPTYLEIEPSTLCNLACTYCPVSEPSDKPVGHMELDLAKRLIDELAPTALLAVLWGWGEPFLNLEVYPMIRHARSRGLQTLSSTNGHLFTNHDHARRIVESGLDTLIVSTSGMSPESYVRSRAGSFELPLKGVETIVEWKRKLGTRRPYICLTLIVTRDNEHEIDDAREIAIGLGVDMLNLKKLNPSTTVADSALPSDPAFRRFTYDGEGRPLRKKRNNCKAMFHKTTLRWDGRINSCPFDFHGESQLGDARSTSLKEIWRGAAYRSLRRRFRTDHMQIGTCARCGHSFEGGGYGEIMIDTVRLDSGARDGIPRSV